MKEQLIPFVVTNVVDSWMTSTHLSLEGVTEANFFPYRWIESGGIDDAIMIKAGIVAGVCGIALLSRRYKHKEGRVNWQFVSEKTLKWANRAMYGALVWNSTNVIADHFQLADYFMRLVHTTN